MLIELIDAWFQHVLRFYDDKDASFETRPDAWGIWLEPLDVEFMRLLDLRWNAEVGFDDVLAGACSDWIEDIVLPFVTSLPEVIEAERSDREVI